VPLVISAMQGDNGLAAILSAIYGRTLNLHLVVAAELSAFKVNAGPYGLVDPMPTICDMRDVRVSWSTVLLSPASWDYRSGVRSCIGQLYFCPIPEFVVTVLAFANLVQVNTQSVINRLQIMEQKSAYINSSVREGRRLSLQPQSKPLNEIKSLSGSSPQVEVSRSDVDLVVNGDDLSAAMEQFDQRRRDLAFDVDLVVNGDDLNALMDQFDQRRRDLASATTNVILLKSSTSPLTVKQKLILKKNEQALSALQNALDTTQTRLFDVMRALVAEKNDALAAADQCRLQLQGMQAAQDELLHLRALRPLTDNRACIRDSESATLSSQSSAESQVLPLEVFDFELFSDGLFSLQWRPQKGCFQNGKLWSGSSRESIFGRMQACSKEKDKQHNFLCLDCVVDEAATYHNGREHVLKFRTESDSKEHVFAFETASALGKCLAQFKS
jgi:hypothetical protein